ncbi:MAG: DUF2752 domain-containing protein [Phycisphaerae bacterium]|nr:DUF2752 domain-containing protein [Phycisphaerae bacterium]
MTEQDDKRADSCHTSPPRRVTGGYRLVAALLAVVCAGVLAVAAKVSPNVSGMGTHRQLNLPACGFLERTGYPCITCGMTTSFSYMVRGQFFRGFTTQPAGALGALLCGATLFVGGYTALSGKRVGKLMDFMNFHAVGLLVTGGLMVLAAWGWLCLLVRFGMKN